MTRMRRARKLPPVTVGLLRGVCASTGWLSVLLPGRCLMVEIIGLGTMVALVWLIAWSMAGESESEKRRVEMSRGTSRSTEPDVRDSQTRRAA